MLINRQHSCRLAINKTLNAIHSVNTTVTQTMFHTE